MCWRTKTEDTETDMGQCNSGSKKERREKGLIEGFRFKDRKGHKEKMNKIRT